MPYTLCLPNRASLQQRKSILPFPWPTISCPAVSSHHCFSPGRSALSHSQGKVCISLLIFRDWEHSHGTANTKYQSSDIIQLYRYCKRHTWTRNSWKKVCSTQTKLPGARTKLDPGSWPSTAPAPAPAPPEAPSWPPSLQLRAPAAGREAPTPTERWGCPKGAPQEPSEHSPLPPAAPRHHERGQDRSAAARTRRG